MSGGLRLDAQKNRSYRANKSHISVAMWFSRVLKRFNVYTTQAFREVFVYSQEGIGWGAIV